MAWLWGFLINYIYYPAIPESRFGASLSFRFQASILPDEGLYIVIKIKVQNISLIFFL
jgi:hypothetical protein